MTNKKKLKRMLVWTPGVKKMQAGFLQGRCNQETKQGIQHRPLSTFKRGQICSNCLILYVHELLFRDVSWGNQFLSFAPVSSRHPRGTFTTARCSPRPVLSRPGVPSATYISALRH